MLLWLVPAAVAAPPVQAEAHALVAASVRTSAWPTAAAVQLDSARLQSRVRHHTDDGQRVAVQTQIEGTRDPLLLDALAMYAPTPWLMVEGGLQRTWVSELNDIVLPRMVLAGRTAPESILPGRRMGAAVTIGAPRRLGTHGAVGVWAPAGALSTTLEEALVTVTGEHQSDAGLVVHAGAAVPAGAAAEAAGQELGLDLAVGYQPEGTRLVAEVATRRDAADAWTPAVALYASHRPDGRRLEPVGVVEGWRDDDGVALRTRAALTWHLLPAHVAWTTEVGMMRDAAGALGALGATRLMTMF